MPAPIPERRIFEAAIEVIMDRGYAAATMAQIAVAADVGEATLFRRFEGKEHLLREALRHEVERFDQEAVVYSGDLRSDLERVVRGHHRLIRRRGKLLLEMMVELPRRPELNDVATIPFQGVAQITALLERYQVEGKLRGDRPWEATLTLLGPVVVYGAFKGLNPLLPATLEPREHVDLFLEGWQLGDR